MKIILIITDNVDDAFALRQALGSPAQRKDWHK